MDARAKVNWDDEESVLLLNPRLSMEEKARLEELEQRFALKSHIWIASSGSSTSSYQSVKLIALSKDAFFTSAGAVNQHLLSTDQDIWVQALPRFHVGGLSIEVRAFESGARIVPGWNESRWELAFFVEQLQKHKGTLTSLVPTQVYDLVQAKAPAPSHLRAVVVGGGALHSELYRQGTDLGWPLLPSYGLTECCSQVATAALNSHRQKKSDLKILSHVQLQTNDQGFLRVHSPALLTGYAQWVDGEAVWIDPKKEGWYQTEDLCDLQDETLKPLGRGSDYVKVSGEGVSLLKLQEILETLAQKRASSQWQQLAVAAITDARAGNILVLLHSLPEADPCLAEIQDEFNQIVAPFERLKKVVRVPQIPRTSLGKIARGQLTDWLQKLERADFDPS